MRGEDVVFFKNVCRKEINVGVVKENNRWRYPYQLELSLKVSGEMIELKPSNKVVFPCKCFTFEITF